MERPCRQGEHRVHENDLRGARRLLRGVRGSRLGERGMRWKLTTGRLVLDVI